jgi:serine/threonine protein kinase
VVQFQKLDLRRSCCFLVNGLEALHNLNIVHRDVKPDNVLVFACLSENMPFQAKLSDFGVCVDLESPEGKFTLSDYRGTPAWLAPEVLNGSISRFGGFSPDIMFKFDAYSFGMVLLSIFTRGGQPLTLEENPDNAADQVSKLLNREDIPSPMRIELRKAALKLLSEDPRNRPLPSPTLLKTDLPTYAYWYVYHSFAFIYK